MSEPTIDYRRFAGIPHGEMCTWAAWVADLEEITPETEADEPRCDCGLGRVIDEYAELVAALEDARRFIGDVIRNHGGEVPDAYTASAETYAAPIDALLARIKGESNE